MYLPLKTVIIGFGHKARHGKDTAAQAIHESYPTLTKIYHFADALKAYCRVAYGMTIKDGPLLQRVGTDEFRQVDPDIWIRALYWQIYEEAPDYALISDVRFTNEAEFIHSLGGKLIKVTRWNPEHNGEVLPFVAVDRDPNHPSEVDLNLYRNWDCEIQAQTGDIVHLRTRAVNVFQNILLGRTSPKSFCVGELA